MKIKGLLLPIFSLPSKFGIGDFGKEAFLLLDLLKENNFNVWQILPLNPISYGHSPYQPYSSYAFDDLYIDLEDLKKQGLISAFETLKASSRVDYETVREFKEKIYKEAYRNYLDKFGYSKIEDFRLDNKKIDEYASYQAIKQLNEKDTPWNKFNDALENKDYLNIKYFHLFKQMVLFDEWKKVKKYAQKLNIKIMGDIPFYVGYDSSDVYFNRHLFLLDENNDPLFVAGVSPDYFSALGQRWGNPIYNFAAMKNDNYQFLIDRITFASTLYDYVRIDHFRAFDTYYSIPSYSKDATIGEWLYAPGYEIFDNLFAINPKINIIAEDLGNLRPEVYTLRDHYHFPGMNVLEFNLDNITSRKFVKKEYDNVITYIGTHDNMTLKSYVASLSKKQKTKYNLYFNKLGINNNNLCDDITDFALCYFNKTIISFVDLLQYDSRGRINTPSTVNENNWTIRLKDFKLLSQRLRKYKNV